MIFFERVKEIMVAEKGQPHLLSAHVKPPAVVLLTARGNQYAARGLWKLSRSYLPRAAFFKFKPPAVVLLTARGN